jgi:RNA polymerase sigma-70 factor (ECF subfamily)
MALSDDCDTEGLIRLARSGDEAAAQRLLARHRDRLKRMVLLRMDDRLQARFDASDVVQEAMLTASRKLPEYLDQRPLPFYPWLRQMALERLVDLNRHHLRAERRSVSREANWSISKRSVAALARQLVAGSTNPSRQFRRNELRARVRQAIGKLNEDDRELILLRHLERLRVSEIAAVLRISEAAVKSRLRRALERLHTELGNDISEDSR